MAQLLDNCTTEWLVYLESAASGMAVLVLNSMTGTMVGVVHDRCQLGYHPPVPRLQSRTEPALLTSSFTLFLSLAVPAPARHTAA